MKRWMIRIGCLLLAVGACIQMFALKYRVIDLEDELKGLHAQIMADSREVHMLEAEWAVKNNPDRLYQFVVGQSDLTPIDAGQMRPAESLPIRPVPPPEIRPTESEEETAL